MYISPPQLQWSCKNWQYLYLSIKLKDAVNNALYPAVTYVSCSLQVPLGPEVGWLTPFTLMGYKHMTGK